MLLQDRIQNVQSLLLYKEEIFNGDDYRHRYDLGSEADSLAHYLGEGSSVGNEPNDFFLTPYYCDISGFKPDKQMSALEHFLQHGLPAGLSPHPLFDARYYLNCYPEVKDSGLPPYLHFLRYGYGDDLSPTPLFDPKWYRRTYSYFGGEKTSCLKHYIKAGASTDNNPCELFDSAWYKSMYGQSAIAGLDPLSEFIWLGHAANKMPNPLFDTFFYRQTYAGFLSTTGNALADYVTVGSKEGRFPNPLFDGRYYLTRYQDVRDAGVNPLSHYLHYGALERRDPSGLFSTSFYLSQIPGGRAKISNPLKHYLWEGSSHGLNPHPAFDTDKYLKKNNLNLHSNALINLLYTREHEVNVTDFTNFSSSDNADGFVFKQMSSTGMWPDNWCEPHVVFSFISSKTAVVRFDLWSPLKNQVVNITTSHGFNADVELIHEGIIHVEVPIEIARQKIIIRLNFDRVEPLSDSDPRRASAVISDVQVLASEPEPEPEPSARRQSDKVVITSHANHQRKNDPIAFMGDIFWAARYARYRGLRRGLARFFEMRTLRNEKFDFEYYMSQNPFEHTPMTDPVRHYILFGSEKGLDPSRDFSTLFYMAEYDDVRRAGINPYLHYMKYGCAEGRQSQPIVDG